MSSELAGLVPTMGKEILYRRMCSSPRMHGSFQMNLRHVHRLGETSREYMPGDPIRLIDWQAYARTDQLLVREVRDEATASINIFIEFCESMDWPKELPQQPLPPTKFEIMMRVALNLAYLHLSQGDRVQLIGLQPSGQFSKFAPRSPSDVLDYFHFIESKDFVVSGVQEDFEIVSELPRCHQGFVVSDLLNPHQWEEIFQSGPRFVVFHTLSSLELEIEWVGKDTTFFDESRVLREYQGEDLVADAAYSKSLKRWIESWKEKCQKDGLPYIQLSDQTGIDSYIRILESLSRETHV